MAEVSYTHFGHVQNGELKGINKKLFREDMSRFEGKQVEVIIRRKKKQRSNLQNRYYWKVVVSAIRYELRNQHGEDYHPDDVHKFLCSRFNYKQLVSAEGEVMQIARSSTELSTI